MSSLIEQAAKRLAQLRKAGAQIPDTGPAAEPLAAADEISDHIAEAGKLAAARRDGGTLPLVEQLATGTDGGTFTMHRAEAVIPVRRPGRAQSRQVDIDLAAISASGMVSPNSPGSWIADQYRIVKRPLLANATGRGMAPDLKNANLVMVTSAVPGEGKTFTAVNLAMSIATELDHTVLLVDADVARPSLLPFLGLEAPRPGLLDLLQDETLALSDVLLKTNIEKLSLLPSGTPHPRATELLASEAMARLIRDLGGRYNDRIIIFDSPPLLATTESHVLAGHIGQVVLVIEAESTLKNQVSQALALIDCCPVKLMILNKARVEFKSGYGYGYGYAVGYG